MLLQIADYAKQIDALREQGLSVYAAIISGGPNAAMARNALDLSTQVHKLANEHAPKAPRLLIRPS